MTKLDYLKERLSSIAQIMKTWAEEAEKESETWKGKADTLSNYFKGKKQAYSMSSEWILETIASIKEE